MATPPEAARSQITKLLLAWSAGDNGAMEQLMQLVNQELHAAAQRAMRREPVGHTLQPTALVNEAYLRLVDQSRANWKNRAQFYGVAANMMRRILVDHARSRSSARRGDGERAISLDELRDAAPSTNQIDMLALSDALDRLGEIDPDQVRIVELRYFTGMNIDETAEILGISPATVKRQWALARSFLHRELIA